MQSKVKIIGRIRPFLPTETEDDSVITERDAISLRDPRNSGQRLIYKEFAACYNYALPIGDQTEELFDVEIAPLLSGLYEGKTIAVLCYGVTSSGKTTTMQGNGQVPGIIIRSVEMIMREPPQPIVGSHVEYQFSMQYFEIYCDDCYDLLNQSGSSTKLALREEKDGRFKVANLSSHQFTTMDEFQTLLKRATKSRHTASTASNRSSSRSHAILNITVFQAPPRRLSLAHLPRMHGRIGFVDLAGSERNKDAGPAPKTRMAESASINKSLTALSRVVTALNSGSGMIPYRDSSLTRVLKEFLGGKSTTLLICNIAPGVKWLSHTRATIEFATKAKTIKPTPKPLGDEESKRRAEQKRHESAEFNLAVEAEVARRMAALRPMLPLGSEDDHAPAVTLAPESILAQEPPSISPPPRYDSEVRRNARVADAPIQNELVNDDMAPPFDDLAGVPEFLHEPPAVEVEDPHSPKVRTEQEMTTSNNVSLHKEVSVPKRQPAGDSGSPCAKPLSDVKRSQDQDAQEAKERYRRKLQKGLKQKHEKYSSSGQPVDRYKFARAYIIAGKMALEEHDDVELAIGMFEKAISWYPENERLLEETLKLKKRLRAESEAGKPSRDPKTPSSTKTPSKSATTSTPLSSTRNGNSRDRKPRHLQIFQFDVEKEKAMNNKQRAPSGEESEKKKKKKKVEMQTRSQSDETKASKGKGKAKAKRPKRAVLEAAASAFADSEVEKASEDSEAEVERSLEAEPNLSDSVVSPPLPPTKAKSRRRKGQKRKSAESEEEEAAEDGQDQYEIGRVEPKESPSKRRRIIF